MRNTKRIKKFLVIGSSAALVNFLLMIFFVEILEFKSYYLKNLANILSIEISIVYNFILQRAWTWKDAPRKEGGRLIAQFASFNLAALLGICIRIIVFAIFEKFGIFYLLNVALGIGIVATLDFILYDKIVFRRKEY
jgi:dolichol-phosphate mannosyltransferase